jgi:hypothetical protein
MSKLWLPSLLYRTDFQSDQDYFDALYNQFKADFLDEVQYFKGLPIRIKRAPEYDGVFLGKESTFRHLITSGHDEASRVIDSARCQRLSWILPVINHADTKDVYVWENRRNRQGSTGYILALSDFSYKVVLLQRSDYLLLWTQFPVGYGHDRRKLQKEYGQLKC